MTANKHSRNPADETVTRLPRRCEILAPVVDLLAVLQRRIELYMPIADDPQTAARARDTTLNCEGVERVRRGVAEIRRKFQEMYGCPFASEGGRLVGLGFIDNHKLLSLFATVEALGDWFVANGEQNPVALPGELLAEFRGAAKLIQALRETPPEESPKGLQQPHADGPGNVGEFWWNGTRVEVQLTPWHVLKAVWDADGRAIDVQNLIDEVYYTENSTSDIPEGRIKTAMNRANEAICDIGAPVALRIKNGRVLLETGD